MNPRLKPQRIVVDIEPNIALARAECLEKYREPSAPDVTKEERTARAMYLRDLLAGFTQFLLSGLPHARSVRNRRV
jgi:hypothetical protein